MKFLEARRQLRLLAELLSTAWMATHLDPHLIDDCINDFAIYTERPVLEFIGETLFDEPTETDAVVRLGEAIDAYCGARPGQDGTNYADLQSDGMRAISRRAGDLSRAMRLNDEKHNIVYE